MRPAVDAGISVSRVGGNAQIKAMKQVAGPLRLSLAQYRELEAFAQFGSDLDAATQRQLQRGARLVEVLKQPQYRPVPVEKQVVIIYAVTNGYLDDVDVAHIRQWEKDFLDYLEANHPAVLTDIRTKKALDDDLTNRLKCSITRSSRCLRPSMAKSRQLKGRIRSVQNTRKITRTMELVATSQAEAGPGPDGGCASLRRGLREVIADLFTPDLADRVSPAAAARAPVEGTGRNGPHSSCSPRTGGWPAASIPISSRKRAGGSKRLEEQGTRSTCTG